jgi:hypothetical protein
MLGVEHWRAGPARCWPVAIILALGGCQSSSSTPPTLAIGDKKETKSIEAPRSDSTPFIGEFMESVNKRQVSPDQLTASFKRMIAPPRDEAARKIGYDSTQLDKYLKKTCAGAFSDSFRLVQTSNGPWILGELKAAGGVTEAYGVHVVPSSEPGGWRVDSFYRSTVSYPHVENVANPELAGAELAAHCFMDNLLGGDVRLAAAVLSRAWKVREYPSKNPSDVDGYNEAMVLAKLPRDWKGNFSEYAVDPKIEFDAGKPVIIAFALDSEKKPKKTFILTFAKESSGEWFIDDIKIDDIKVE